jgi:Uma2 family endonuclease
MPGSDQIKPAHPGVKLTYDDFLHLPDDGRRHELIDGEHYVTPAPIRKHQAIVMNLGSLIWIYLQQHPIGRVFGSPLDVILSDFDVVEPDLSFITHQRMREIEPSSWIKGAPNLVVEIVSPNTRKRDETIKRRLYERFGIDEYWVIDPELDTIKVYRRTADRYERTAELSVENGDVLTTSLLPGLDLPLAKIFED